ncbi:2-hydroxymuconate-semialdehyde hydrolase [Thermoflexales bacterium]|nr:2-hydroxymuconate-semialdehyde hydrolase [Thermoflexales bacterium]
MTGAPLTVQTGSFTTHCEHSGDDHAETILFLHGSGPGVTAWSNWQFALPALADRFHCLAPDLVGFGATEYPQNPPMGMRRWMRLWVDQCLALLDAQQLEKVHLVGNSMGGAIALHLLMEAPERFERVVLMGSIGTPHAITPELDRLWGFYDDPSVKMFRGIIRWFVYDDTFIADRLDTIAQTRFEAAMNPDVQRSFKAMFPAPRQTVIDELVVPELALRRMDHPVLLIHGRDDKIVPLETSLHLLQHLSKVQLHVFGQCSHWTQIEFANKFNQLLAQFFTGQL